MRTARRLHFPTVAVYSDADCNALHVSLADESVYLGASRPSESYLNVDRIMHAVQQTGADSLHPGYGFLSENSALRAACDDAGIAFIGPPAKALQCMASKSEASKIAMQAGVPILPGFREAEPESADLLSQARKIGFPVLLKAALGGGGRGMSIVHTETEMTTQLEMVRAQAREFFGDDLIIVEKYLSAARHIEVQIAADRHGNVVHLFDRDCSAQRRYQKIVEEAPAPEINDTTRHHMYEAAKSLAQVLDYHNVGTVEFLLSGDDFYFIEMNTRLQVEHPVTEMITGVDLVEWQFRITAGEAISQQMVPQKPMGHSIQARIYAENPAQNFLPSPGGIRYLRWPIESERLQIHTGYRQDDHVDVHYDSLIAKVVVHEAERKNSIARLQQGLSALHIVGVDTNIEFLSKLLDDPVFQTDTIDIKYVENHRQQLASPKKELPYEILAAGLLYIATRAKDEKASNDHHSPWCDRSGWRLYSQREFACSFEVGERLYNIGAVFNNRQITVKIKDQLLVCTDFKMTDNTVKMTINGKNWVVSVVMLQNTVYLFWQSSRYQLCLTERLSQADTVSSATGSLAAPLPGRIARVLVQTGDSVSAGQMLIVIEAMKMEHPITSPFDGKVIATPFAENQLIDEGTDCIVVEPLNQSD